MFMKDSDLDMQLYDFDPTTYEKMLRNTEEIYRRNKDKFMGEEFKEPFKQTKEELEDRLDQATIRYNFCINELNIDPSHEKQNIESIILKLKNGNYVLTPSDEEYRNKWLEKEAEYYDKS